jgi:predicted GNAT family acetyltransferase
VAPEFEGEGVGSALVRTALDDWRKEGRRVLPLCPFAKGWIERHPEYADLVSRPRS